MSQPVLVINDDPPSVAVLEGMKKYVRALSKAPIRILRLGSKETGGDALAVVRKFGLKQAPTLIVGNNIFSGTKSIIDAIPKYLEVMRQLEMDAKSERVARGPNVRRVEPEPRAQMDQSDLHAMLAIEANNRVPDTKDEDEEEDPEAAQKRFEERRARFMHDLSKRGGIGGEATKQKARTARADAQEVPISRDREPEAKSTQYASGGGYEEDPSELVRAHMLGDWHK